MDMKQISGQRQYDFMADFNYIREAGTDGEVNAAKQITEKLNALGVTNHIEEFSFDTFEVKEAKLIVTAPYEKEYTVTGYAGCGNTPDGGVEAPFLYAEHGDDISLSFVSGKIVMVNHPVNKEMYQKLIKAGAVGFVSINGNPVDTGEYRKPASYRLRADETPIQGVNIHHIDAIELVTKGASKARLVVKQNSVEKISRNVIARIDGTDKAEEILTLTAHFDSVPAGPGAYDNMAGAAIIMELCRYFKENRPRRSLEFIWFGAEEKGLLGSRNYVEVHKDELSRHRFNMNVDLAGQLIGGTVIGVAGDASICPMINYIAHEIGMGVTVKHAIWGSDSNTFAWKGIPAMTLNRDGYGMHTHEDTIDLISPWSLERSAKLLGYLTERLTQAEVMPFPQEIPAEFIEQLENYFNR